MVKFTFVLIFSSISSLAMAATSSKSSGLFPGKKKLTSAYSERSRWLQGFSSVFPASSPAVSAASAPEDSPPFAVSCFCSVFCPSSAVSCACFVPQAEAEPSSTITRSRLITFFMKNLLFFCKNQDPVDHIPITSIPPSRIPVRIHPLTAPMVSPLIK